MQYLLTEQEYTDLRENHRADVRKLCLAYVEGVNRRCPMKEKDGICDGCAIDAFCWHPSKVYYSD